MKGRPISRMALALALCAAGSVVADAKPLGNAVSVETKGNRVEIRTADNELVTLELYAGNILRVRAGAKGALTEPADKTAKIVIAAPDAAARFTLSDMPGYRLLKADGFALRIYAAPLRFEAYDPTNTRPLWRDVKPIDLSDGRSFQTVTATPTEQFFGGGMQNGSFAFRGKVMEINYSGGWEEGDRPNPAPFYFSSAGYGVLRNSWTDGAYDFRSDDYAVAEHKENRFDAFYIFGPRPAAIVDGVTRLTGRPAMLPRWGYEYGDADCYNDGDNVKKPGTVPQGWSDGPTGKTPDVVQSVAAKYREHDMPGGWILPNDGYGCGYTALPEVVKGLAKYGFRTGLWTESGMDKIAWEVGNAGTRVQKIDVAWSGKGYQFALDANHDAAKGILDNSTSRPVVWTVMGWAGIQRYAISWTGDQSGSWDYIRWHIPTYIGSGLSGQAYAASDVDGIFGGAPETFTRDLQWKSFTPVLMGMSGWSANERKHPWWFEEPYRSVNRRYLKLRQRLMPYLYTYARGAEDSGAPIVRGLLWDHPADPNALNEKYKFQYFYGRDFLVAPVYRSQAASRGWREGVYLPEGRWIDYWDGRVTDAPKAGKRIDYPVTLDTIPVLVRAGAIIPMYPESLYDGQVAKTLVTLDIYPHGESRFDLYEDDGNTRQYKDGASSRQVFTVSAPTGTPGRIAVSIGAVEGRYAGMEPARGYELLVHTRFPVASVTIDGQPLKRATAAGPLTPGSWRYDPADKYGTLTIRTGTLANAATARVAIEPAAGARIAATPAYPVMPPREDFVPADEIKVVNRPLEEPGKTVESAFDGKGDTWFRTSRDLSVNYGAPEFTLYFGERKAIDGFDIAPRNDKNWKVGQVRDYEIYVADNNGEWGAPAKTGRLELKEGMQSVRFAPVAGRLFRFRILSAHDPESGNDPMVLAAGAPTRPVDPLAAKKVGNVTISEFRVHEFRLPEDKVTRRPVSDFAWAPAGTTTRAQVRWATADAPLRMNGVAFARGFGVPAGSRVDLTLTGFHHLFRADVGVDDGCAANGNVGFQVWGDDRLLFDSGPIKSPAVVKPEIDIRGIKRLSLRTTGTGGGSGTCAAWANASITGGAK